MKILRIIYDWPPPWDGLAAAPYEMTKAQKLLGHDIEVFCGRWPNAGSIEQILGVKLHSFIREPLSGTLALTISPLMFLYYLWWRRTNTIDVIHSHGHFAIWIYWYRRFLKKNFPNSKELKIPLVVHFHNTVKGRAANLAENNKEIKTISRYISWPMAEKSDRWAVEVANSCIFVSHDIKDEAIKYYGAKPDKCFVVETGVNPDLFSTVKYEERVKTRKELGFVDTDKVILNHGAMVERKNVHLLIEAVALLPFQFKLLLVGPESDADYEFKLKKIIQEKHMEDRIVRVGYTPYPQVPIAFQSSDLFVLPSSWEGLPKVVMQSLSCGVPALASGFKASHSIDGLYYIKNLDAQTIARQIFDILESHNVVDINFVRSHYSWHVMAKKVDAVYENL
ncbi:glycosyltransferase family 4 protein [candidate division WWE3 bacterium]|nr:glycosyltransferase family 4 protein [candidate division WWE3 bacterium]